MKDKEKIEAAMNEGIKPRKILTIISKPKLSVSEDEKGVELNDGYDFEVNGALPELADGIAKFARELPNNGFGPDSGSYFITLIGEYYKRLSSTDVK